MMSTLFLLFKALLLFCLLLLLSTPPAAISGTVGISPAVAARPSEPRNGFAQSISLEPKKGNNGGGGRRSRGSRSFQACLPKGFRRTSAPSRYVNYQPLGSACSSGKVVNNNVP